MRLRSSSNSDLSETRSKRKTLHFKYWGKSSRISDGSDSEYHLLVYHSLDVAAVGYTILTLNREYLRSFSRLTGIDEKSFVSWFTFLVSLHDIGKFATSFQCLNPAIREHLQGCDDSPIQGKTGIRHDTLGYQLWKNKLRHQFISDSTASKRKIGVNQPIDVWMAAMVGHHGKPPQSTTHRMLNDDFNEPIDYDAASQFVEGVSSFLLPNNGRFPDCDINKIKFASWWLAGLAVLCDWLGSNTEYFAYKQEIIPLSDYWEHAKTCADRAVRATGVLKCRPSGSLTLADLIEKNSVLTPLQEWVSNIELSSSPQMFILEDVTGSGKTEAAILLAHRLMNAGMQNSLYFALPTMATANGMYSRIRNFCHKLFEQTPRPSLVLAHSARNVSTQFRNSIIYSDNFSDTEYAGGLLTAEAHCNAWLADNRKKALLADIGIGTIDQALLAILPSQHQSLRLLGLVNKILLIDEVHACDAYMHVLLCKLLRAHAAMGGSAILLSATLPEKQRQKLLDAYSGGQGWNCSAIRQRDTSLYPLVTQLNEQGLREQFINASRNVERTVNVKFLHQKSSIVELFTEVVEQDQCVCWIRNSVKDATETFEWLSKEFPHWQIKLFHARFALNDRLEIENHVLKNFGVSSSVDSRRCKILIATQVVEQSLDLDFDTLVTDLAPVDLIIQRAGRLRRHKRNRNGNPVEGEDQRGGIWLHVFSPKYNSEPNENWFSDFFPNSKRIYANHGQLWLTASLLDQRKKFTMPDDARILIEGVYGEDGMEKIPETLLQQSFEAEGNDLADASLACLNALSVEMGYCDTVANRWWDESSTPTRLGEESKIVYLAKWRNGALKPWVDQGEFPWFMSSVSIPAYLIDREEPLDEVSQEFVSRCKNELPAKGKHGVLLPMSDTGSGWQGTALNQNGEKKCFIYNMRIGLQVV